MLNYDHFLSLVILSLRAPNPKYRREVGTGQISKSDSNGGYTQPKELGRLQAAAGVSDPSELPGHLLPYFKS